MSFQTDDSSPTGPSRGCAGAGAGAHGRQTSPLGYAAAVSDAATWARWKEQTFGSAHEIGRGGLNTGAVTRRRGARRAEALAMLRLGLTLGDSDAAAALAAMGDATAAESIRRRLGEVAGAERVKLALALHELRPDPSLAAELVAVLQSRLSWSERIDAAIGLRSFRGADDEAALLAAVADPDYLVRYHACESLLARWRVRPAEIARHADIFPLIGGDGPPTAADLERLAEARARLLARARQR